MKDFANFFHIFQALVTEVSIVKVGIIATALEQLLMITLLEDYAFIQYDNAICRLHGREAMGDEHTRGLLEDEVQRCLDLLFGEGVDAGGGFIQNKNRGSLR